MEIKIPELSLIALIGVSGSGKSTFAKKYFKKTEILSSDECRAIVSDDENNQLATNDAFELLYYMAGKRLKNGLLTVIDSTNVQKESRRGLVELAKKYHCLPVAIVLDIPEKECRERNQKREDRNFGSHVIKQQSQKLKKSIKSLKQEGFRKIYILKSLEEIESITGITREKLYNNKKDEAGPFDIIGDIHGCLDELKELLIALGYSIETKELLLNIEDENLKTEKLKTENLEENNSLNNFGYDVVAPEKRKVVFVGDLVDRGPDSVGVLRLVMSMVNKGIAYCVSGNHDSKLQRYLSGKNVSLKHGLDITVKQLEMETDEFKNDVSEFLYSLISHYVFDNGKLVVAHAGIKENMQGRGSGVVRSFCMYGDTTGEIDEFGLPVRNDWAADYRGEAIVVYGHVPVPYVEWLNKTIDIDTGCAFGGKLTALRYPEGELIAIDAKKVYCEPIRPINFDSDNNKDKVNMSLQHEDDDLLNIKDFIGKKIIETRHRKKITIKEENSISALETMSRFGVNPKWLIYLPPTMSPCPTSELPNYLEYPSEALNYYRNRGVEKVICEEKHMGSRAILVICKDEDTAVKRFGIKDIEHKAEINKDKKLGICYTRTGRNFFNDEILEKNFILRVNQCLTKFNFWEKFETDWVCLDAEIMPWSLKAMSLIKEQYAGVGASAKASLPEAIKALRTAYERGIEDTLPILEKFKYRNEAILKYIETYQNYSWRTNSIDDYKLAPFHILATEKGVHTDKNHEWHMENIARICECDKELFLTTNYKIVDLNNEDSFNEGVNWWLDLTSKGGEGMVVKPYDFITRRKDNILQPAIKCRGREYLRIIYGPEYDFPENMERLKNRELSKKQSLALKEFYLGIEGLERFLNREPLRRIHETVFAILALESQEIDPRL